MSALARFIATGVYTGYTPVAPGTAGSLLGAILYWAIPQSQTPLFLVLILSVFFAGVWSASRIEEISGVKDNQIIVADEIVGVWLTLLGAEKSWPWLLIGFVLFRLFDIIKPFPVKRIEKLAAGWGVMLDDVIAGIYGLAAFQIIIYLSSRL